MDKTLVKILNMATSGSYDESNNAIEQAYKYMKRKGQKLEDIEFNSLYNGDVIAIKLIARFAHEQTSSKQQGDYISSWASTIYGNGNSNSSQKDIRREIQLRKTQNANLAKELAMVKRSLVETQNKLLEEQQNVEKYLDVINGKHSELLNTLNVCKKQAAIDSERSKKRVLELESELKKLRNKNNEANELYKYMVHAKELQISNIQDQLKILLGNFKYKALRPLIPC
ncbi:MAG: hypothetical protein HQL71_03405 [Magnetococcales bacterium]|nr:hypothetical protein [Magnetococcales bacterium]